MELKGPNKKPHLKGGPGQSQGHLKSDCRSKQAIQESQSNWATPVGLEAPVTEKPNHNGGS